MMSKTIQDALNEQMKQEFYSSYLYLSMSAYCDGANLPGLARWMRVQAQEEIVHAMKIFDHVLDRGGKVELKPLAGPPPHFASPGDVFGQAHKHEQEVTASINKVYGLAVDERDFASTVPRRRARWPSAEPACHSSPSCWTRPICPRSRRLRARTCRAWDTSRGP
jgi:ferritin